MEKAREVVFILIMARFVAILFLVASPLKSEILLSDNFDGSEIDNSKWDVFLPYTNSAVYLQNGVLKSKNCGFIVSKQTFSSPYSVAFVMSFLNSPSIVLKSNDDFLLRKSGLGPDPFSQANEEEANNGFVITFGSPIIFPGEEPTQATEADPPLIFRDYGSSITAIGLINPIDGSNSEQEIWPAPDLYPDGKTQIFTGTKIGFFGSSADTEASLFSVQVSSLPEPSALSLLAVGLGVVLRRRRRTD